MVTSRELLLSTLSERIAWFRQAPRLPSASEQPTASVARGPRARRHFLMTLPLSNRDHENVTLRPLMWTLFEV